AERLAHTTKGVSGNIGATLVQDRAAALEAAIRANRGACDIEQLLGELDTSLVQLLDALACRLQPEQERA
ncbi:MAG TPA: Hpt domain-containing protein, partial [Ramlibacter sp.]|nr:Hpt domain-containing protein [Ramlibacter sp.]